MVEERMKRNSKWQTLGKTATSGDDPAAGHNAGYSGLR